MLAMNHSIESMMAVDGTILKYHQWASEGQPNQEAGIAIVHGIGLHGGRYHGLAKELSMTGRCVYALDLRGHGLSGGERGVLGGPKTVLSDIVLFLEHVYTKSGCVRVWLVGESMGALFALAVAPKTEDIVSQLVLIAPGLSPHRKQIFSIGAFTDLVKSSIRNRELAIDLTGWRLEQTSREADHIIETRNDPLMLSFVDWRYLTTLVRIAWNWKGRYAQKISLPTLIVQGRRDVILRYQSALKLYQELASPIRKLELMEEASHAILWDTDAELARSTIRSWLLRPESGREV
jgi:alpha-beta hydrolase superfamily lysophospholipase